MRYRVKDVSRQGLWVARPGGGPSFTSRGPGATRSILIPRVVERDLELSAGRQPGPLAYRPPE